MGMLRFILAISVVLAHSSSIYGFNLVGDQIAVQAFFIISGFYMALILSEKYVGINGSYKLFITNRFLRLYPVYWTVLLLTLFYSIGVTLYTEGYHMGKLTNYVTYSDTMGIGTFIFLILTNLFIFLQDLVMFLGLDTSNGHLFFTTDFRTTNPQLYNFLFLPQAWTIGLELAFYLIAPFIVKRKINIVIILILLSALLRVVLHQYNLQEDPWSYRFFPTELLFFLLGIVAYRIYVRIRTKEINSLWLKIIFGTLITFTFFYEFVPIEGKYYFYLAFVFVSIPFIFLLTKNWKKDAYIGELSYPIYISHLFVLLFVGAIGFTKNISIGLSLTIVTVLFSILLNELVAKKIEKIRQKRVK
jgi:peptidoglycan/LPS O-acetylase OafA/YrhL